MKSFTLKQHFTYSILATLALGLAPFGEPHLFGKIKWVLGGAKGMKGMDWFDFVLHGAPWVYLIIVIIYSLTQLVKKSSLK
jgi:hypothetical protein